MKSTTPETGATPLCRHFRTKKMFIPAQAAEVLAAAEGFGDDDAPCWCNLTMSEAGRDDRPVGMRACREGRGCFEG